MRESRTYGSVRGARDETHVPTATEAPRVHHYARRGSGRMAACRSWAVDDAANPSDDSKPATDRGGPRETYRPDVPTAIVVMRLDMVHDTCRDDLAFAQAHRTKRLVLKLTARPAMPRGFVVQPAHSTKSPC